MHKMNWIFRNSRLSCLPMITKVPVAWLFFTMIVLLHIESRCAYGHSNNFMNFLSRMRRQISGNGRAVSSLSRCSGIHVEIIVSPQISNSQHDLLVLYWEALTILPGDKVVLYDHDPKESVDNPLRIQMVDNKFGWVVTDISEGHGSSISPVFTKICLGYWVAYIRGDSGAIAASSCLSTEPRWMEETWFAISRLTLANLFVPGTHNSASYKESYSIDTDNIVYRYTYNQEISVLNQLLWGSRALDLRIGYYPHTKEIWWCNHDFVRVHPLNEILGEIKLFLNNTQEIVILDVHNFPIGFLTDTEKVHQKLMLHLENELRDYLVPSSLGWSATLQAVSDSGGRAILAYNDRRASSDFAWAPVQHKWGNIQNLNDFVNYFKMLFNVQTISPWAAMVELTPRPIDVFLNTLGSLRQMAAAVNPTLTSWFNGEWGRLCHIVHCDFIRGTGVVKAAIKWNLKRAGYHNCNLYYNSTNS